MDNCLTALLAQGIKKKVFPGAAAAVSWRSESTRKRAIATAGIMDIGCQAEQITENTFFDLASLSKALSTTLILFSLIEKKTVNLDDRLQSLLDYEISEKKKSITVRQLLCHSSGFVGYKPYYQSFVPRISEENYKLLLKKILVDSLEYEPGSDCQYSDMGFILLGYIAELLTGKGLQKLFQEFVSIPLGLTEDIFYLPITGKKVNRKRFAATEKCPWRGRTMRAEVHDEHCWLMNGVSGHAGLFGNIHGVLRLCETILDQWQNRGKAFSWSGMLDQGLRKQYTSKTWCLGFDGPSVQGSSGGEYISAASVGHLGYAGTSFWIDPEKELVMVLLTNRVHPTRENTGIQKFRPFFHNRIIEELRML